MGIDPELTSEIIRRVLSVARPERIILFGSAATGKMTRDSDIDLLLVEKSPQNTHQRRFQIGEALRGLGYGFDVFIITEERFQETKNVIGGIAYPANKYGKVIHEAG